MTLDLPKGFGSTVYLHTWDADSTRWLIWMFTDEQVWCPIKAKLQILQLDEKGILGVPRLLRDVTVLHQLGEIKQLEVWVAPNEMMQGSEVAKIDNDLMVVGI
jgi:hypothetical protein